MKNLYILLLLVTGVVSAQVVNIPDASFKARLIAIGVDLNSDGQIQQSEAQSITEALELGSSSISDLTGISAFTNMKYLRCEYNNLTSLTVTAMPNLKTINVGGNTNLSSLTVNNLASLDSLKIAGGMLGALDVSTLGNLKYLDASVNHITTFDLTNNTQLKGVYVGANWISMGSISYPALNLIEELDISSNGLGTLNVSAFTNLRSLNCSGNQISNLSISNLSALEFLSCGNNQMAVLSMSNLPMLHHLYCGGNFITNLNLSPFAALQHVEADGNHFASLGLAGLTNLDYLSCALTQLPAINVSTLSALKYLNCAGNQIATLDLSGLTNLEDVYCGQNAMTSLNINGSNSLHHLECANNQLANIDLTGHSTLYLLDCGTNPMTSLDLSQSPNLSYLRCNNVPLTVLDVSMLSSLNFLDCANDFLTTLDCSNNTMLTWLSFYNNNIASVFIKNGANESIDDASWIENNLQYVCADESQLAQIQAVVGAGVAVNSYCSFIPGGDYNTITGTIRFDDEGNGCDSGDGAFPYVKVNINDGTATGSTFLQNDSAYSFYTNAGSYTVSPDIENPSIFNISPVSAVISFPSLDNSVSAQDFCISANGVHPDLEIVIAPVIPARPGFDAIYKVVYKNKGNQVMGATYGITFSFNDNLMSFVSASPNVVSQVGGTVVWDYSNLMPFESKSMLVTMHVNAPTATNPVNVGDVLTLTAIVSPQAADENVIDNTFQFNQTVIGSYDPNDITCIEGDVVSPDEIGEYLHYVVRFENTGTYPAENIVVKNVIDATQFDVNSLRVLSSSHSVDIRITGNVAEYIFKNINLGIGGHGNILLKLKTQNTLAVGTTVSNAAGIYFDYNLPVDTNIANTTFQQLAVGEHNFDASISVYPNPADGIVNIKSDNVIKSVVVYDIQGRILQHIADVNNITSVSIDGYGSGIYFLKIRSDKGIRIEKIMKK
jgi:uncharacterized repeat protein (TIGR01451 family)